MARKFQQRAEVHSQDGKSKGQGGGSTLWVCLVCALIGISINKGAPIIEEIIPTFISVCSIPYQIVFTLLCHCPSHFACLIQWLPAHAMYTQTHKSIKIGEKIV